MSVFINLYGAPGAGKSVKASEIMVGLRKQGYSCEIVPEAAKEYVMAGKSFLGYAQLDLFIKQLKREQLAANSNVDFVICECPLLLVSFYGIHNNCPVHNEINSMAVKINSKRTKKNFFIVRNVEYDPVNRMEESKQSDELADEIRIYVRNRDIIHADMLTTEPISDIWDFFTDVK